MICTTEQARTGKWQRLVYRGPAIDVLFNEYARRRRIDDAAPITASHEVVIDAPTARVWEVLSRPDLWSQADSRISHVQLENGVTEGARFTWRNGRTRLTSRFAVVEDGRELTWTGQAMGAKVVHRHVLAPTVDGKTRLFTEESMAGCLLVLFFDRAKLHAALEQWLTAITTASVTRDLRSSR
jgi:hypothetical protein